MNNLKVVPWMVTATWENWPAGTVAVLCAVLKLPPLSRDVKARLPSAWRNRVYVAFRPSAFRLSRMPRWLPTITDGLIHAARVMSPVTFRLGAEGTLTNWPDPLRLNAWPTWPGAKVAPPTSVPLLVPALSLALPSAPHRLTRPLAE